MGLAISAYKGIAKLECTEWEGCCSEHAVQLRPSADFMDQADGLEDGCYSVRETMQRRVQASYSGYNRFREWLCGSVLAVTTRAVWNDPGKFKGRPFVELINFSDCEGVIGPLTSAKLAQDFDQFPALRNHYEYGETYQKFAAMFAFAADSGAVHFG